MKDMCLLASVNTRHAMTSEMVNMWQPKDW